MHALDNSKNNPNLVLLTSLLKVFSMFLVMFEYEQTGTGTDFIGIAIKCVNF